MKLRRIDGGNFFARFIVIASESKDKHFTRQTHMKINPILQRYSKTNNIGHQ